MAAPTNANAFKIVGWSSNRVSVIPASTLNPLSKEFVVHCSGSAALHVLLQTRARLLSAAPNDDEDDERGREFAAGSPTLSRRCVYFCDENERPSRREVLRWLDEHVAELTRRHERSERDSVLGRALRQRCGLGENVAVGWLLAATPARRWPEELGKVFWCTSCENDASSDASDSSVVGASE